MASRTTACETGKHPACWWEASNFRAGRRFTSFSQRKTAENAFTWTRFWREFQNKPLLTDGNYALTQKRLQFLHLRKAKIEQEKQAEMDKQLSKSGLGGK